MDAHQTQHPSDQLLVSYHVGKLDDSATESVGNHLKSCSDCRRRVAEMSSEGFLDRARIAQGSPETSPADRSGFSASYTDRGSAVATTTAPSSSLPAGLADHPDYEVIRELGRGGMGVVYLAQNKLMGRLEVLKVVGGHLIERPGVRDRFLREVQAAARLHHTNIVTAYSALRLGDSLALAMEFVEGLDLARMVKTKGPLPVTHACYYIHQAALGLQHAHQRGMVHRDIKPANLIVARDGNKAVVKVLDFGLAKVTSEGQADSGLTREGQMLGTPDYIAPEQIRSAQSADIRADIYSLGCTLYYVLTGGPPFRGEHLWDVYQAHFSMDADPLNLVRPEVPVELAALVGKMMAKEPGRRFRTPGEVAQALTPFFKKVAAIPRVPTTDLSQPGPLEAKPGDTEFGSVPTRPATGLAPPALSPVKKQSDRPRAAEPKWESLIEFKDTEPSPAPAPDVAPPAPPRQRPTWMRPTVIAASVVGVMALGVIIYVASHRGQTEIVVEDRATERRRELPRPSQVEVPSPRSTVVDSTTLPQLAKQPDPPPRSVGVRNGFVQLFNGVDLTGWKTHSSQPGNWHVENGNLVGAGPGAPSHLYTVRGDFQDFHLRAEVRINGGGNSGVYARASFGPIWPVGKAQFPHGYEAQIYDGVGSSGQTGSLFAGAGPPVVSVAESPVPALEWFDLEIRAEGNRVVVMVNGKINADYQDVKWPYSSGHIALQHHDSRTIVEFRRIEIKELDHQESPARVVEDDGFRPLFNGRNLSGWNARPNRPGVWRVENGILVGSGGLPSYLYTERGNFSDVHIRVEARINDAGNSGVFARAPTAGATRGYEAQINFQHQDPARTGSLWILGDGAVVPIREALVPSHTWFRLELIVRANRITVIVDGRTTADYWDQSRRFSSGHIVLQMHDSETIVEFRKIEVKELNGPGVGGPPASSANRNRPQAAR